MFSHPYTKFSSQLCEGKGKCLDYQQITQNIASPHGPTSKWINSEALTCHVVLNFALKHRWAPAELQGPGTGVTVSLRMALPSWENCFSSLCLCIPQQWIFAWMTQHSAQVAPSIKSPCFCLWAEAELCSCLIFCPIWPVWGWRLSTIQSF